MNQEKLVSCLGLLAGAIGFTIIGAILNGWALSILWGWFIVPVFKFPQLTIIQAIGVAMVASLLTKTYSTQDKYKGLEDRVAELIGSAIVAPVLAVGFGWLVLQFA